MTKPTTKLRKLNKIIKEMTLEEEKAQRDWDNKMMCQNDYSFIEHVIQCRDFDNEEDRIISILDGDYDAEGEEEDIRMANKMAAANAVYKQLPVASQELLDIHLRVGNYQRLADEIGVSLSTGWKRMQLVLKQVEEIKKLGKY